MIKMTTKDLADLIFPNITKTIADYEAIYPERDLKEGARVTRFAPSPTGFMHIGNFMSTVIDYVMAKNSGGVFYLRNEDTDSAREIEGAVEYIRHVLDHYNMNPDEYEYRDTNETKGIYGPYIQSERKEIYHAFIKHLIIEGKAYPCFLTQEEMDSIRESQTRDKRRIGIYGRYAKYRNLTPDEAAKRIENGEKYTIRLKSQGDFNRKFKFTDLVNGDMEFPENDIDIPIMKSSNLLPTYHFAHLVDDHLMHTTHVIRGQEWVSSVPVHYELFKTFGFKMPKYVHTPLILKKDGDKIRKISKRLDPEARMTYYEEKGYPIYSVIEAVMTIANSNYEAWRDAHPDAPFTDFDFSPKKMSPSGALFDLDKLDNISKNYLSRLKATEVYDLLDTWSKEYDVEFNELINKYKDYTISVLNIEREQKKPRKDYASLSEIKGQIWYMYDELYTDFKYNFNPKYDKDEIKNVLNAYFNDYYDENDDKDTWFNKMKELSEKLGFCSNMKEYKENPDKYKGSVADISNIIRVGVTSLTETPDLYIILKLLGKNRIKERINNIK
ncbi:MAG TPA: glutamate--tRNA ligase [Firmicutes bacterium]|nr:glutamate--tRNA ligase [Bacillota bacterium]